MEPMTYNWKTDDSPHGPVVGPVGHARYVVTCKQGPVTKQTPFSSANVDAATDYARSLIGTKYGVTRSWVIDTATDPLATVWDSEWEKKR